MTCAVSRSKGFENSEKGKHIFCFLSSKQGPAAVTDNTSTNASEERIKKKTGCTETLVFIDLSRTALYSLYLVPDFKLIICCLVFLGYLF